MALGRRMGSATRTASPMPVSIVRHMTGEGRFGRGRGKGRADSRVVGREAHLVVLRRDITPRVSQ